MLIFHGPYGRAFMLRVFYAMCVSGLARARCVQRYERERAHAKQSAHMLFGHGVMIYCTTFQKAVEWNETFGGDGSMCGNRKMIGRVFTIVAKRLIWRGNCSVGPHACNFAVYTIQSGGITAYTLDGGGDVFANGKWSGPY